MDDVTSVCVENGISQLCYTIKDDELLKGEDVIERFVTNLDDLVDEYKNNREIIERYLTTSKKIDKNDLGE